MKNKIFSIFIVIFIIAFTFSVPVFAKDDPVPTSNQMEVQGEFTNTTNGDYKITIGKITGMNAEKAGEEVLTKYRNLILLITGFATLTMSALFVVNFAKLAKSGGNPQQRQGSMMGIILTGIGTVIIGGVTFFFAFFYQMLQ